MKLTHVILYYPSMEKGGIEVNIRHLVKYLTNKGIKITLISSKINTKGLGVNKKNFKLIKTDTKFANSILPYRFLTSLFSIKKLIKAIKDNKKENTVVFSMQSSMVSILVSKFYKTKIVAIGGAYLFTGLAKKFGNILILTFAAAWFNWFPPIIYQTPWDDPVVNMTQLFFPCLVLGASQAAIQVRMMRTTMLEVLREDYIRTANAKGLKKFSVLWRHAMKNALIPVVTISGSQLANLIGGALVTETVFNLPGIGAATVDAVRLRDYPVIQNFVLIITTGHVLVNLLIDLLYGWLNPRIRYS